MDSSSDPVRWGVLGAADIALRKVIPAMQTLDSCRVEAIASRSSDKAEAAAAGLDIPRWYGTYEQLLEDPEIEVVYIPLPNHLHWEWTIAAAEAGKHVLCEKPLAMSSDGARKMIDACRRADVKLMEAFMYRLHPLWVETRRLVEAGAIGRLAAVQTVFSYHNVDPGNIRNRPEYGGGALYDIGCYAVNSARMLFGSEPIGVRAAIERDPMLGTDILTSAILVFEEGQASFVCSTQMEPDQRVGVFGSEGRLVVEIPFNIPPDRPTRILHYAGGQPPVAPGFTEYEIPVADQYAVQAELFSAAVRGALPVPTPPEDAVANLIVMERIFATAAET